MTDLLASLLGELTWPLLVRLKIGPIALSPHGIGIALGFLAGAQLMLPEAEKRGIPREHTQRMLGWALIGALVGSRLFYVINHVGEFESPAEWFMLWRGGFTLLGGIAGGMGAAYPLWRSYGYRLWQVMDAAAPGLALGVVIGRLGDLAIGDHLGKPTSFVLGFRCPDPAIVGQTVGSPCPPGVVVHQAALYDFLLTIPLLVLLLCLRRRPRWEGFRFCVWLAWYGTNRLIEDFTRIDRRILGLTGSQYTAIAMIAVGLFVLLILRRSPSRRPAATDAALETATEEGRTS